MGDDSHLFESAWLKWAWAVAQAETMKSYVEFWASDAHIKTAIELWKSYDAKRHRIDVFVGRVEPLPIQWGLLLGDIAHNFRSCLDHIAWALVERGGKPPTTLKPRQRNAIYFPICGDRADFNGSLPSKLPGVGRADIAIVR